MRIAIVSDIHGNRHALEAVLEEIDRAGTDEIWCLGDTVGYGADPNRCCELVAERCAVILAGNHDLVVRGDLDIGVFSAGAAAAARWTAETLDRSSIDFLAGLEPQAQAHDCGLYHASPRDPVWEYVLSIDQAYWGMRAQPDRVCFIGHSHVACHFTLDEHDVTGEAAAPGAKLDLNESEWLINPGSVGQPRDGNPEAAYLLLDSEDWKATFKRVEYPIAAAANAIIAAGLPAQLGERLYIGH